MHWGQNLKGPLGWQKDTRKGQNLAEKVTTKKKNRDPKFPGDRSGRCSIRWQLSKQCVEGFCQGRRYPLSDFLAFPFSFSSSTKSPKSPPAHPRTTSTGWSPRPGCTLSTGLLWRVSSSTTPLPYFLIDRHIRDRGFENFLFKVFALTQRRFCKYFPNFATMHCLQFALFCILF